MAHRKETDKLNSDAERPRSEDRLSIEFGHAKKLAKAGEKHQPETGDLEERCSKKCISLRRELEKAQEALRRERDEALEEGRKSQEGMGASGRERLGELERWDEEKK